jgi:ribonuclease HI
MLPVKTPSSSSAELCGIHQTIKFLHEQGDLKDVEVLMLQCDNTNALAAIMRWAKFGEATTKGERDVRIKLEYATSFQPREREWAREVGEWTSHMRSRLVRHVRGHQQGTTTRSWVNEKCDEIAKDAMRRARRKAHDGSNVAKERVRKPDTFCRVEESVSSGKPNGVQVGFLQGWPLVISQDEESASL